MSFEVELNGKYNEARRRLMGNKPVDENAGAYRKLTGSSNEALQLQINRLNSQIGEMASRITYLASLIPPKARIPTGIVERIIDFVCEHESVTRGDIMSNRRGRPICRPRLIAYYLSVACTSRSLPQIAKVFGRDHTTILKGRDRIQNIRWRDPDFDSHVRWYEEQIKLLPVNSGDKGRSNTNRPKTV